MGVFRHGRIIGAYLRTKKGKPELHPAIIMTPNESSTQPKDFDPRKGGDNVVVVMGVSTKYALHSEPFIKLPFHASVHPVTRLTKDCAAIIGWYDIVHIPDDHRFWAGDVPAETMVQINDQVRRDIAKRLGRELASFADVIASLLGR